MTQASPVEAPAAPDVEPEDTLPPLENIGRDFELLNKRILTHVRNAVNGTQDVTLVDVMRLQSDLVSSLMDHITHTKRMEEHAVWATEVLTNLEAAELGTEAASQLHQSDAEKYTSFFDDFMRLVEDGSAGLSLADREAFQALRARAQELKTLTEEITLEKVEEADEDDEDDDTGDAGETEDE